MKLFPMAEPGVKLSHYENAMIHEQLRILKENGFTHINMYGEPGHYDQFTIDDAMKHYYTLCKGNMLIPHDTVPNLPWKLKEL